MEGIQEFTDEKQLSRSFSVVTVIRHTNRCVGVHFRGVGSQFVLVAAYSVGALSMIILRVHVHCFDYREDSVACLKFRSIVRETG